MHARNLHLMARKMIVAQMARKMTNIVVQAAIVAILLTIPTVISDNTTPIPAIKSQVNSWFQNNVKPHAVRKANLDSQLVTTKGASANLDPQLVNAEAGAKIIKVRKDGSGDFKTVNDAIKSIPVGNNKRVIVWIGGGEYKEKIVIERNKPFVTLYGSPNAMPTLTYDGTALQYGTVNSATLAAESDYFIAANIIVSNSSPRPDGKRKGAQAVALRVSGDKAALYNCKIIGFQDTLCDDRGKHLFKDCYIEGTVDFIFGSGKSLYLNTELHVIGEDQGFSVITAQARESELEDTGYSFVHCSITGNGKNTYLGRAWQTRPRVVYAYTNMGSVVNPKGWSDNFHPERDQTVFFREYKCSGPGSITTGRVKFSKILGDAEAQTFLNLAYIEGSKWLLPPPKL